jgi:hypothetical protein
VFGLGGVTSLHAYLDKRLDKHTLKIYIEELADIPPQLLQQAASQHIRTSPYFPRIADLRQVAHQISGAANFSSQAPAAIDYLHLQAFEFYNALFKPGEYEEQTWQNLIKQFEKVGRFCCAEELRQQLSHIRQIQAARLAGRECPSLAERRSCIHWVLSIIE